MNWWTRRRPTGDSICVFSLTSRRVLRSTTALTSAGIFRGFFAVEGVDYDRLEVSSPGLDRPLRKTVDFVRFSGQKADVKMLQPNEQGRKRFVGILQGVDGNVLAMEVDGARVALELDGVERAKLVPDL